MRVEHLGEGDPEVAVVGAIHGDEPCGARAVERLLAERPPVERPVKLVVANERALARKTRYVDVDLNRAFPGEPDADEHERRLAHRLRRELRGCTTVALHSTRSYAEPFALVGEVDGLAESVCPTLPIDAVVEIGTLVEGRLFASTRTIEVECGRQGTDAAAENAYRVTRAFLAAMDVLAGEDRSRKGAVPVFRLGQAVPKEPAEEYAVFAENFERVAAGETFAEADGEALVARESFYPVLMSADGYDDQFGYTAERVGGLGET